MNEAMLVSQATALAAKGRVFHRQISYDDNHAKRVSLRSLVTGGTEVLADSLRDDGLPGMVAHFGIRRVHLSPQRADALIEEDGGRAAAAWPDGACIFTTGAKIAQAQRHRIQQALRANLFIQYGTTEFGTASIAGADAAGLAHGQACQRDAVRKPAPRHDHHPPAACSPWRGCGSMA